MKKLLIGVLFLILLPAAMSGQHGFIHAFDGTKITYSDEGKGQAVLLLHGFMGSQKSWDKTALKKALLAKGYRVIAPDLRGNGDSDKPQTDIGYSGDAEVRDLLGLIDHLGLKRYMAVGYSRGSIVLAKLLTKDKRIKKAVLGGMGIDFTNPDWERRIQFAAAFDGHVTELTKGAVDHAKSIGADFRSLHLQQKYQPVTTKKELALIKKKVLVIAGDEDLDNGIPLELKKALPKGSLRIVPGNHNETYKTSAFSHAILAFLK